MNGNGQEKDLMIIEGELMPATTFNMPLIIQFADRLMSLHPAAREVGVDAMRMVAQLALTTGANPLPGTNGIHVWKDERGKLAHAFGIGFWRGEAEKAGGIIWCERPRPMSAEERKQWNIPDGIGAAYCRGALSRDVFGLMRQAQQHGIKLSLKEAKEEVAQDGVGTVNQGEYLKKGRPASWTATERAERDMLRKLVPIMKDARQRLMTGDFVSGGADWSPAEFVRSHDTEPLPEGYNHYSANTDLFGDDPAEPPVYIVGENNEVIGEIVEGTPWVYPKGYVPGEWDAKPAEPAATDPLPMDWQAQAEDAQDIDVFSAAFYQLHKQVFSDANGVKRAYGRACGEFKEENNLLALAALGKLAQALGDGVKQSEAIKLATAHFTRLLQEKIPLPGDVATVEVATPESRAEVGAPEPEMPPVQDGLFPPLEATYQEG